MTAALNQRFQELGQGLDARFLEREEAAHGLILALISRHHLFLVGPPGTAKSAMISWLAKQFEGSNYFQWLLTRFSTPDELFGPVDLAALKAGSYQRITKGKLPESVFAFLDELFKANSAILNNMLSVLQERIFHNDGTATECPLETCVGASNELPEDDEALDALYDRFLLRYSVNYIGSSVTFKNLLARQGRPAFSDPQPLTRDELTLAQNEASSIPVSDETLDALVLLRENLGREGIVVSDRRFVQLLDVLRAEAWLRGDTEVTPICLEVAGHVMWTRPEDARKVMAIVLQICDPYAFKSQLHLEAAEEAMAKFLDTDLTDMTARQNASLEANAKLVGLKDALAEIADKSDRAKAALAKVNEFNETIMVRGFGLNV